MTTDNGQDDAVRLQGLLGRAIGERDALAYEAIFFAIQPQLLAYAQQQRPASLRHVSAEDFVQQAWRAAVLYTAERRFHGRTMAEFIAWMRRVIRHDVIDAAKRPIDRSTFSASQGAVDGDGDSELERLAQFAARITPPHRRATRPETTQEVRDALEALPDRERDVIRMYRLQGQRVEQIAATLGLSKYAVYRADELGLSMLEDAIAAGGGPPSEIIKGWASRRAIIEKRVGGS